MTQPFEAVNAAMRDRDDKFTKREMIAMHIFAETIDKKDTNAQLIELAVFSAKAADILLQELRKLKS